MSDEKPTPETRLDRVEERLALGARTFAWVRGIVVTILLSSVGAAAGVLYQSGRNSAFREVMAEQVAELRIRAGKGEESARAMELRATALETLVRAEQDRRAALEEFFKAVAGRRRR